MVLSNYKNNGRLLFYNVSISEKSYTESLKMISLRMAMYEH